MKIRTLPENLGLLKVICADSKTSRPNLNKLLTSTIDAILANGALSAFFNIKMLIEIRNHCIVVNKLLDFTITGTNFIPATTFYNKINEICPILNQYIIDLLHELLKE